MTETGTVEDPAAPAPAGMADAPPAPPAPPPRPRRRGGFVAPFLGGVLAAAAGYGLAQVVPGGWPLAAGPDLAPRIAAQAAALEALEARVAALPPPPPAPDLAPLQSRLAALEQRLDAAEARAAQAPPPAALPADLEARIAALEERAQVAAAPGGGEPAEIAALRDEVAALRAAMAAPDGPAAEAVARAAGEARAAMEAARDEALRLHEEAQAIAAAARRAAALDRLRGAAESGAPFAAALEPLRAGGAAIPPALEEVAATGIPALAALQASFPEAARRALDASRGAEMGATTGERIATFLRQQAGIRALTPREGDDPDAVLSRAEAAVAAGNLAGALEEIAALPEAGRAAMADWTAAAGRRLAALAALDALAAGG